MRLFISYISKDFKSYILKLYALWVVFGFKEWQLVVLFEKDTFDVYEYLVIYLTHTHTHTI
jgi:hypothetical protein